MKIKFFVSLFIIIIGFSLSVTSISDNVIVIDVGHGGEDSGTEVNGILEKDLNLEVALKLEGELVSRGYKVILTRNSDVALCNGKFIKKEDMINRCNIINTSNARMCISIHMNYFTDSKYSGTQVFYSETNKLNQEYATVLKDLLNQKLDTTRDIVKRDNIYLLNHVLIPCVLIECGFLSNEEERKLLQSSEYQMILAIYISDGIDKILR